MTIYNSIQMNFDKSSHRRTDLFRCFSFLVLAVAFCAATANAQLTNAHTLYGDIPGDAAGTSVSGIGDINGDFCSDVVVGMPGGDLGVVDSGTVRVYSGLDGSILFTFDGDLTLDSLGSSVSGAGDVNNDGVNDVIAGAPGVDTNGIDSGMARVYSGTTGVVLYTVNGLVAGDSFGSSVSGAGDVNNDGFADFIVGSPNSDPNGNQSGSATVFSGIDGSVLYTFIGDSADDQCGSSVSDAGDVNDDGSADVIVGIPGANANQFIDSGRVRVFSGADGSTLLERGGDATNDRLGSSVAGAGDIDEDDFDDFMAGSPAADSVRVYSGVDGSTIHNLTGTSNSSFGASVSNAGDVNADGINDVIVGASGDNTNGAAAGAATVFSGLTGLVLQTVFGDTAGDLFGSSVSGAGDINADAFADVIVGALGDFPPDLIPNPMGPAPMMGSSRIFTAPFVPVLVYNSLLADSRLRLRWTPDLGDPNALSGTISCSNATPGAFGRFGLSLAPANSVIFGFPLLLAIDPVNLIDSGNFGYGFSGAVSVTAVSRQNAFLAGSFVFIQFFESAPIPASSNGIAMLVVL